MRMTWRKTGLRLLKDWRVDSRFAHPMFVVRSAPYTGGRFFTLAPGHPGAWAFWTSIVEATVASKDGVHPKDRGFNQNGGVTDRTLINKKIQVTIQGCLILIEGH